MKLNQEVVRDIWKTIKLNKRIIICGHIDTDGDSVGSALALKYLIEDNTAVKDIKIIGEKPPRYLSFMDEIQEANDFEMKNSLHIVVDTSTKDRIADQRIRTEKAIKIDHHHKEGDWLLEIGGDYWPATGEILWEMAHLLDLQVSSAFKDAVFVSIWTDTEGLTQRNVSERTKDIVKKCSLNKIWLLEKMMLNDEEVNHINNLKEKVKQKNKIGWLLTNEDVPNDYIRALTAQIFNEFNFDVYFQVTKYKNEFRGELRSRNNFDVSVIAKLFGGGGHKSASGFKVSTFEEAKKCLENFKNILEK